MPEPIDPVNPEPPMPEPVDPVNPEPIDPVNPEPPMPEPVDPVNPEPVDPVNPEPPMPEPVDPVNPEPVDPVNPEPPMPEPVDPVNPEPVDPINPEPVPEPVDPVNPEPPVEDAEFNTWVQEKMIEPDGYANCNMNIFTEWHNEYRLFAGHNCEIFDLKLTVFMSPNDYENNLSMISSDHANAECKFADNETYCCEFVLTPATNKLGLAFDVGSDAGWTFETEWTDCVENM